MEATIVVCIRTSNYKDPFIYSQLTKGKLLVSVILFGRVLFGFNHCKP